MKWNYLAFVLISMCAHSVWGSNSGREDTARLPNIVDVKIQIEIAREETNDPEHGFGEAFWEFSDSDKALVEGAGVEISVWLRDYGLALEDLLSGRVSHFHDRLLTLEQLLEAAAGDSDVAKRNEKERVEKVALLYVWAIEVGVEGLDPYRFEKVAKRIIGEAQNPVSDRISASLAYIQRNPNQIATLANNATDSFEASYLATLLARLEPTPSNVAAATSSLLQAQEELGEESNLERGKIALMLAEMTLLQADSDDGVQLIDDALSYAGIARRNLEYFKYPILWTSSHRITYDALELALSRLDPDDRLKQQRIEVQMQWAYELTLM